MPSLLTLADLLAAQRRRMTMPNLRELVSQEAALPSREEVYHDITRAMNRAGVPEDVRWKFGRPLLPGKSESIFNFEGLGDYPHGYLQSYLQPITSRGVPDSVKAALRKGALSKLVEEAKHGASEGRQAWYDLSPVHRFIDEEVSPENQASAERLLRLGPPLSQQTSVPAEFLGSTYLNRLAKERGVDAIAGEEGLGITAFGGGASPRQKIENARAILQGQPPVDTHVKLNAYGENRKGNLLPPAMDSKTLRLMGISDAIKAEPKGASQAVLKSLAARMGVMPAQLQAMLWPPGKGTAGAEEPLAAVINNILYRSAKKQGIDPKRHAIDVFSGDESIPFSPKELGFSDGGLYDTKLSPGEEEKFQSWKKKYAPNDPGDDYDYRGAFKEGISPNSNHHWVDTYKKPNHPTFSDESKYSGGNPAGHWFGDVFQPPALYSGGGLAMLAKYINSNIPKEWRGMLRPVASHLQGTGRTAFFLEPHDVSMPPSIAKIVGDEPRGIAEQSFRDHLLEKEGLVPKRNWESRNLPEITIEERIFDTPQGRIESWLKPMTTNYGRAVTVEGHDPFTAHQTYEPLRQQMHTQDLDTFLNYDILGGDFFGPAYPKRRPVGQEPYDQYMRTTNGGVSMRADPALRHWGYRGDKKVLLDQGALIPDLLRRNYEEEGINDLHSQLMDRRFNWLLNQPETRDMLTSDARGAGINRLLDTPNDLRYLLFRDKPEGFGFAKGGHLDRAKKAMAKGGPVFNWLRGVKGSGFEDVLSSLKKHRAVNVEQMPGEVTQEGADRVARAQGLRQWIDKNFSNYLARQFGTPDDPLREITNLHAAIGNPERNALIRNIKGADIPTSLNKGYFKNQDELNSYVNSVPWIRSIIEKDSPRKWSEEQYTKGLEDIGSGDPEIQAKVKRELADKYQRRNAPPVTVHDIDSRAWERDISPHMIPIMDYLSSQVDPASYPRVSVGQALAGSKRWHEELAKKKAISLGDPFLGTKVHKEYPSGFKWVQFDPETARGEGVWRGRGEVEYPITKDGRAALEEALKREGDVMGHCVGDYCDDVVSGNTQIFSLRDAKGEPHVTVEVAPGDRNSSGYDVEGYYKNHLYPEFQKATGKSFVDEFAKWGRAVSKKTKPGESMDTGIERFISEKHPDFKYQTLEDWDANLPPPPPSIVQIKGKANRAPIPEYLPYVQDFVRSGKWGDVGDIQNAGLRKYGQHFMTPDEASRFARFKWLEPGMKKESWLTKDEWIGRNAKAKSSLDPERAISDWLRFPERDSRVRFDVPDDWKPQGFADGGLADVFKDAEAGSELPPGLLREIARAESNFNPNAKSKKGAIGLMQFMPSTARQYKVNPLDPRSSVMGAKAYLVDLLKRFGDLPTALAAYNWGPGRVRTYGVDKMPASTRRYVHGILARLGVATATARKESAVSAADSAASVNEADGVAGMADPLGMGEDYLGENDGEQQALAYLMELLGESINGTDSGLAVA